MPVRVRVNLLGVGSVPVDGVTVGHHLGSGVLAVHTHPNDEDEEEEHFHLRHIFLSWNS